MEEKDILTSEETEQALTDTPLTIPDPDELKPITTTSISNLDELKDNLYELATCSTDNFSLLQEKLNLLVADMNLKYDTLYGEIDDHESRIAYNAHLTVNIMDETRQKLDLFESKIQNTQQNVNNFMSTTDANFLSQEKAIEALTNENITLTKQNFVQFILLAAMLILSIVNLLL